MSKSWQGPILFALLAGVACGAPPARPPATPRESPPVVAPPSAPPPASMPEVVGALERPRALEKLFAALARLETGEATDDVRFVQLGDSHTAADWETGPMRRQLQERFGDGGRGFVPIGLPWKAWSQEGVLAGESGWSTQMNHPAARHPTGDGVFGLSGVALSTRLSGARAWLDVLVPTSRAELDYLEHPGGGSFDLFVDGARVARIATRAEVRRAGYHELAIPASSAPTHHIEARAVGDGEVRLFGLALDRAERGLVFDALGINGARVANAAAWEAISWGDELRHRAPAVVIVAFGTNDAVDFETPTAAIEAGFIEVLGRIAKAVPSASCLVLGPPDRASQGTSAAWTTPPRLVETVARERHAAETAGCAFYDQMAVMGGPGAMARWAAMGYPLGQKDRVHLTREGYAQLASAFVGDLLRAYDTWRSRGASPSAGR